MNSLTGKFNSLEVEEGSTCIKYSPFICFEAEIMDHLCVWTGFPYAQIYNSNYYRV